MLIEPFYVIPDPFVRGPGLVNTSQLRVAAMFTAGPDTRHLQYLQYLLNIYTVSTQHLHSIYTVSTQYLHSIYTVSTQYLPLHSGLRGQGHSLSTSLHTYIKSFPPRLQLSSLESRAKSANSAIKNKFGRRQHFYTYHLWNVN